MEDKEFKVGDRVRLTTNIELDDCFLQNGETAYVEEVEDDTIIIKMEARKRFHVQNFEIELDADADPKTAFLHDLSELLRKYDAKIDLGFAGHAGENPYINIALGDNGDIEWTDSTFYNKDFRFPLTADNVLNYDK